MTSLSATQLAPLSRTRLRDGAELAYSLTPGRGSARFALVHSLAMTHVFWSQVAERLLAAGDVLTVDCRGHGVSSASGSPFTVEQFADDLAEVFDTVGWPDAVVAGASMGGTVSLAFADAYPGKTRALGLIDTTAWYGADAPERWEERAQKARDNGMEALVAFQKKRWLSEGFAAAHPDVLDDAIAVFLANDVDAYAETCRMLGRADKREALARFSMPVGIVVGSEDFATPLAMAEQMRGAISAATLTVLDGAAHLTPLERPDDVAAMLLALAEGVA